MLFRSLKVAAILRATIPDLPTPDTTTLEEHPTSIDSARSMAAVSKRLAAVVIARASSRRASTTSWLCEAFGLVMTERATRTSVAWLGCDLPCQV